MLRDMKIAAKLMLGFILVLVITVFLAVYGIIAISQINDRFRLLHNYPTERYKILNYMSSDLMDIRRIVSVMSFRLGDTSSLNSLMNEASAINARITGRMEEYQSNLRNDTEIDPTHRDTKMRESEVMYSLFIRYYNEVVSGMLNTSMSGTVGDPASRALVEEQFVLSEDIYSQLTNSFNVLAASAQVSMDNRFDDLEQSVATFTVLMIVLSIAGVVIGIGIALLISGLIAKPIREMVDILENVSLGNLNVNIRTGGKDEVGMLAESAKHVVDTISSLVHDLEHMSSEHERGDIDVYVDTNKYKGEYKTVANQVNEMVQHHIDEVRKALAAVDEIAKGNFNATLERFPLKKAFIHEAFDVLHENVTDVNNGISGMIEAAAVKGDMHYKIDESLFTGYGQWLELVKGLNAVCKAVDDPVVEIRDVMERLGQGRFDKKVEGNYTGDFSVIKEGVNGTIESLQSYINEMSSMLSSIASGDLTRYITREYIGDFSAIKESINHIRSTLHQTMAEINAASAQVLSGARQISTSAMDLANGATQQASSVEELNASIDLINRQTNDNATNAAEANSLSSKSSENALEGNEAMKQMLEAMLQIKESSNNISRIIKVIQDIAFQTNLLSLNAAVEAARAGEHGKGFSVVAEEVRNLAARSQTAATETTTLIEDSINRVDTGSGIAEATAEALNTIVSNASEILQIINGISTASREQAEAVGQVSLGLNQISQVVQSNSAVSEETAAAAEELNSQAEILQQLVSYFKL